ncbi:DUF6714 family protein [Luteimonas sp. R10]|uniref:DUF6714 family protein n=1 Tax=Luteimonas sp. R10 TaxID=3108176 RepID=UPI003086A708|nr:DUF6714 family protein [Luteimonas sp. R10]
MKMNLQADVPAARRDIENEIRFAFTGVVLGDGTSIGHAEYIDCWGKNPDGSPITDEQYRAMTANDIVDDWTQVTLRELERDNIAHFDPAGFRYYLPALLLSLLDDYDPLSMRTIGTLSGLRLYLDDPPDRAAHRFSLLNDAQKRAVARFLVLLPEIVELTTEDEKIVRQSLERYWSAFLQQVSE